MRQDPGPGTQAVDDHQKDLVLPGGVLLIALSVAFRAWTLYPSWFYADDQRLLVDARTSDLDFAYLTAPFDSQFMPLGRLIASMVAGSDDTAPSWTLAVGITLLLLTVSGAACLAMLIAVFGQRWQVLPLLALFLTSTTALPASMWWAASLNQLPFLITWCGAVGTGVMTLRTRRPIWVVGLVLFLAIGLTAYIKTLLIIPVLAWLAVAYFAQGPLHARLVRVARQLWWVVAPLLVAVLGVAIAYRIAIPQPFTHDSIRTVAGPLADSMLGTSWATSAVGGPWRWSTQNPPVGVTDPPDWAAHLAWVVVVLTVCYAALRRRRTGRAWGLLGLCLVMDYLLLLLTRAPFFGAIAGNEMRYLTESAAFFPLVLGLAFLPVLSAVESSEPRQQPALSFAFTPLFGVAVTCVIVVGSLLSSAIYVHTWHTNNPGEIYLTRVAESAKAIGSVDLVDDTVPDNVMAPYTFPYNTLHSLLPLRSAGVEFPEASGQLSVVTTMGAIEPAVIEAVTLSDTGPVKGCGWPVRKKEVAIPLAQPSGEGDWWVRIGYLSSDASTLTLTAGSITMQSSVISGLGSLFVHVPGDYDHVDLAPPEAGTTLCVDRIEVGKPVARLP